MAILMDFALGEIFRAGDCTVPPRRLDVRAESRADRADCPFNGRIAASRPNPDHDSMAGGAARQPSPANYFGGKERSQFLLVALTGLRRQKSKLYSPR